MGRLSCGGVWRMQNHRCLAKRGQDKSKLRKKERITRKQLGAEKEEVKRKQDQTRK
jgi:hypothetical protein